jgi:hypothetical protein
MHVAEAGQGERNSALAATRAGASARSIRSNPTFAKNGAAVVVRR